MTSKPEDLPAGVDFSNRLQESLSNGFGWITFLITKGVIKYIIHEIKWRKLSKLEKFEF